MSLLTYKTGVPIEHRSSGFRCHGTVTVCVQYSDGKPPVVDVHCEKCKDILEVEIGAVELADERLQPEKDAADDPSTKPLAGTNAPAPLTPPGDIE